MQLTRTGNLKPVQRKIAVFTNDKIIADKIFDAIRKLSMFLGLSFERLKLCWLRQFYRILQADKNQKVNCWNRMNGNLRKYPRITQNKEESEKLAKLLLS